MSGEQEVLVKLDGVSRGFGERLILDNVDLDVMRGETLFVVGPSGVGKSVTIKHMIGLLTPDSGRVLVGDVVLGEVRGAALEKVRERFGVLFQSGALLAWLSVEENVALPLREKTDMGEDEIQALVMEKLGLVGLAEHAHKQPSEISGGMRKRAALARAIVRSPEILLYDEPTSGLDPVSARSIDELIQNMQKELGVTSVVVTHDLHSALTVGSRIAMITDGKFVEIATPRDFVRSKVPAVREFLEAQFITRKGCWEERSDDA